MLSLRDEESSPDRSPGDTLPWNLPRHHRFKRSKSASAEVLDPAERAVIRIAGELYVPYLPYSLCLFIHAYMDLPS